MKTIKNNEQYFDTSFIKLTFSHEQYDNIEFEDCQFKYCDFSEVLFENCNFINCIFENCNLSLANFSGSKLFELKFEDCKLVGIDWTKAEWPTFHLDFGLSFSHCTLNDSSFFGLTLHELSFNECKLHDVDFREGDYTNSSMRYCDFRHALFMKTNLQGVNFSESEEYIIDVLENNIKGAKFSRFEALSLLEGLGIELID
ncbi:pentapeptide repeat-containing protein [Shewanella sp. 202IG2-18]|uniref:pentapeptide repeat-containing protein n=1 Tax=Parashewanella hymeniacidonis TaxID=2807618 RepID=UPI0019622853|nr:pentapeptide repeat-containing protein [Parashewanella hymeniacidonis]MBM7074075.1 pentapeptide repeat-containing protein [Parashewanella hymeniacidonis]